MLRSFVNDCIGRLIEGKLDAATASMAKYIGSEIQGEVMDECLQLFGGYGFMWEYPIARLYADARVQRIYGGTNEIMKELIRITSYNVCYTKLLRGDVDHGSLPGCLPGWSTGRPRLQAARLRRRNNFV